MTNADIRRECERAIAGSYNVMGLEVFIRGAIEEATDTLRAERDAALAEMRRLTAKWGDLEGERDALTAENERLRGALERIRDRGWDWMSRVASEALSPTSISATGACRGVCEQLGCWKACGLPMEHAVPHRCRPDCAGTGTGGRTP